MPFYTTNSIAVRSVRSFEKADVKVFQNQHLIFVYIQTTKKHS